MYTKLIVVRIKASATTLKGESATILVWSWSSRKVGACARMGLSFSELGPRPHDVLFGS